MSVYREVIKLKSHGTTPTYINITPQVKQAIEKSGVKEGIVTVVSPHTTCAVFFEEFVHDVTEDGTEFLQIDLNNVLEKIIPNQTELPPKGEYLYPGQAHFDAVASWPDAEVYLPNGDKTQLLNCEAHLKATIIGSSQTLTVENGNLGVGVTGYIYFVDFDRTRSRDRKCKIVIIGE